MENWVYAVHTYTPALLIITGKKYVKPIVFQALKETLVL